MKQLCLDCDGGIVDFLTDDVQFITSTKMESTCNKCGAKWTLRELLNARDTDCADCDWPADKHPNTWCKSFRAKQK